MLYVSFCTAEQSVLQYKKGFLVVYYGPFRAVKKAFSWLETGFSEIRMSIKQVSGNFRTLWKKTLMQLSVRFSLFSFFYFAELFWQDILLSELYKYTFRSSFPVIHSALSDGLHMRWRQDVVLSAFVYIPLLCLCMLNISAHKNKILTLRNNYNQNKRVLRICHL